MCCCRFLAGNGIERLGAAAKSAADVGCDIFLAYLEELQLLGMALDMRQLVMSTAGPADCLKTNLLTI